MFLAPQRRYVRSWYVPETENAWPIANVDAELRRPCATVCQPPAPSCCKAPCCPAVEGLGAAAMVRHRDAWDRLARHGTGAFDWAAELAAEPMVISQAAHPMSKTGHSHGATRDRRRMPSSPGASARRVVRPRP